MSQDQENLDLMQEGIDELEGSVDLKTALAQEKAKEKSDKEATKFAEKVKKNEERIAAKQAKLDEKALKAFEKESAKAEKLAIKNAPKILQPVQNGQRHPKENTNCGKAWAMFAELSKEKGAVCTAKEANSYNNSTLEPLNENMIKVNHWAWKKYHGLLSLKSKNA